VVRTDSNKKRVRGNPCFKFIAVRLKSACVVFSHDAFPSRLPLGSSNTGQYA
jgi:hypothetical protein